MMRYPAGCHTYIENNKMFVEVAFVPAARLPSQKPQTVIKVIN